MASILNVKTLRLRLGWTQSDLARRLKCQVSDISSWEYGLSTPSTQHSAELELLSSLAEACALEMQIAPRAENICATKSLGQIQFSFEDYDKN